MDVNDNAGLWMIAAPSESIAGKLAPWFWGGCCQALMVGECYVNCLQRNSSWTDCKFNDKLLGR